jgi:hypothetical protein
MVSVLVKSWNEKDLLLKNNYYKVRVTKRSYR